MAGMLKLLIIKTSSMGDVIHNLAIVQDILKHYPDAQIDWVVEQSFADIPRLHPAVNQVFTVALRQWRKALLRPWRWRATFKQIQQAKSAIAAQSYDVILDSQGLLKSAWLSTWAKGQRHGYDRLSAREALASCFYHQRHQVSKQAHAVSRNRLLAALALNYRIAPKAAGGQVDFPPVDFGLSQKARKQALVMAFHGSSRDSKLWPTQDWIALCHGLAKLNLQVALPWASEAEHQRAQQIAAACRNAQVLPASSIASLAQTIAQAQLAIGVDTGLSHLAVALGIPTIGIYTDTDPNKTGLYADRPAIVNLGGIALSPKPQQVLQQAQRLLTKRAKK